MKVLLISLGCDKNLVDSEVMLGICRREGINIIQEEEKAEREKIFKNFQINDEVMAVANDDAMVLHCLPAHREEEITAKVFEEHADEIFDEAENRLHAQKAVLVKLLQD